jgi:hypothetical protein
MSQNVCLTGCVTNSLFSIHNLAAKNRSFHFHIANRFRFEIKNVVAQDNHVSQFARRDGPFLVFLKLCEGYKTGAHAQAQPGLAGPGQKFPHMAQG